MARLLNPLLSQNDFAAPELAALVLDGEVYRVDECVAPLDEVSGPIARAQALAIELPERLIAEQHTAAWVWGVLAQPPRRHEVCADTAARSRPALDTGLRVREVVIANDDTVALGGIRVTTPMRTAIDLARFVSDWNHEESRIVFALLELAGVGILDCARVMNRRRNLPGKRLALERLAASR